MPLGAFLGAVRLGRRWRRAGCDQWTASTGHSADATWIGSADTRANGRRLRVNNVENDED